MTQHAFTIPRARPAASEPPGASRSNGLPSSSAPGSLHVELDGEPFLALPDVDRMEPFLMTVVADADFWLFAGSNGGFTAGRADPDHALFPYRTADQILRHPQEAGVACLIRAGERSWEPWDARATGQPAIQRCLYKHACGCAIRHEETNHDLALRCTSTLIPCDEFGLVRECRIDNLGRQPTTFQLLDGWHGILPPGVAAETSARFSYLAAAYMRHELHAAEGLGLYTLNCGITDRPEPFESLHAAVAWSCGHHDPLLLLSDRAIREFRQGAVPVPVPELRGEPGAYLALSTVQLLPGQSHRWFTVADTGLDHAALSRLKQRLADPALVERELSVVVATAARRLERRIAGAGAIQLTADRDASVHHFANVLFNCMRGGVPLAAGRFPAADFVRFLSARNRELAARHRPHIDAWPATLDLAELTALAARSGDPQLDRLAGEFLPLTFSRRHGDPSRPWNRFAIRLRDPAGNPACCYSGNWRDLFQNWESLAYAYPGCCPAMIAVFLNATTADGYNPYRISDEGIEWEVQDPGDPWSHIGYWGDHQIVYLHRLLRAHERFWPGRLVAGLDARRHAYALVPYEIRSFDELLSDPRRSIRFDAALHERLVARAAVLGNDAKLLPGPDGQPLLVTLAEKLLVPALVKLSNLVPDGGIWLNTQRPEWNDGNNALAGWGLSVVTVCHLHAYLDHLGELFDSCELSELALSTPVARLLGDLAAALPATAGPLDDKRRAGAMERLGRIGERHRQAVYQREPMTPVAVGIADVRRLIDCARSVTAATIAANRRPDGLFHAYNVLDVAPGRAVIVRLQLMLEGQVAAIAAGTLTADEALCVLESLRRSDLYRPDQHSYLLQPDQPVRPFEERNRLPAGWRDRLPAAAGLLCGGQNPLVVTDAGGIDRFAADLPNERALREALRERSAAAGPDYKPAAAELTAAALGLWEEVFGHRSFIGRSGAMFAFEGLGSIYWHMVAKLLLSVQELHAAECRAPGAPAAAARGLATAYQEIRAGLGFTKSPAVFGAFPTDPYSHTPRHLGAQQPGMTGQVKEEILTRLGELGVVIDDGCISFSPRLLHTAEFLPDGATFRYHDAGGNPCRCELPPQSLAFTLFDIPVIYQLSAVARIRIERADGTAEVIDGPRLPAAESSGLFLRSGAIARLHVGIPRHDLLPTPP